MIGQERFDLGGCGRQPGQIEAEPANQDAFVGLGRRRQPPLLECRQDESIDGIARPGPVIRARGRGRRAPDRLETPVQSALLKLALRQPLRLAAVRYRGCNGRAPTSFHPPWCTSPDPLGQGRDLAVGELRLGRHLVSFAVVDRINQQALLGIARHDRGPRRAARQNRSAAVEPQPALLLGRTMAPLTPRGQDRPHALLEELDRGGIGRRIAAIPAGLGAKGPETHQAKPDRDDQAGQRPGNSPRRPPPVGREHAGCPQSQARRRDKPTSQAHWPMLQPFREIRLAGSLHVEQRFDFTTEPVGRRVRVVGCSLLSGVNRPPRSSRSRFAIGRRLKYRSSRKPPRLVRNLSRISRRDRRDFCHLVLAWRHSHAMRVCAFGWQRFHNSPRWRAEAHDDRSTD